MEIWVVGFYHVVGHAVPSIRRERVTGAELHPRLRRRHERRRELPFGAASGLAGQVWWRAGMARGPVFQGSAAGTPRQVAISHWLPHRLLAVAAARVIINATMLRSRVEIASGANASFDEVSPSISKSKSQSSVHTCCILLVNKSNNCDWYLLVSDLGYDERGQYTGSPDGRCP